MFETIFKHNVISNFAIKTFENIDVDVETVLKDVPNYTQQKYLSKIS